MRGVQLALRGQTGGFPEQHEWLILSSACPVNLAIVSGPVAANVGDIGQHSMYFTAIQFLRDGLISNASGLVQAVQRQVCGA